MSDLEKIKPAKPPKSKNSFDNKQLSLFQDLLCNTEEQRATLSNTIEMWDVLPKYSTSIQAMNRARTKEGFLKPVKRDFKYKGVACAVTMTPAIILRTEANERIFKGAADEERELKAYLPSANEEIIEDCLRKLAAEQYSGFFENEELMSLGVRFTLYQLSKELQEQGHSRSYREIIISLEILAGSGLDIETEDGKIQSKEPYMSLGRVSPSGNPEDPKTLYFVRFHSMVAQSVKALTHRQFNYHIMLSHKSPLSRWIHRKLAHEYRNASITTPYKMLLSSTKRDSGYLDSARTNDNRVQLEKCLDELKNDEVLMFWKKEEKTQGRRIIDITYSLTPSQSFVSQVKASNKRTSKLLASG